MPSVGRSSPPSAALPEEGRVPVARKSWGGDLAPGSPNFPPAAGSGDQGLSDTGGVLSDAQLEGTVPTSLRRRTSQDSGSTASHRKGAYTDLPGTPTRSSAMQPPRVPFPAPAAAASKPAVNQQGLSPFARRPSQGSVPSLTGQAPPRRTSGVSGGSGLQEPPMIRQTSSTVQSSAAEATAPAHDTTPAPVHPPRVSARASATSSAQVAGDSRWDPELADANWRPADITQARDAGLSGMAESILVKRVEYIPVHVARQKVKELCAEMARTRHEHLAAIERVEGHYAAMKAEAEKRVAEYVETLAARHREEVVRLRDDHAQRTRQIRGELLGRVEEEVELAREKAAQIEQEAQDKVSDLDKVADRNRRKEDMKAQGALRLLKEEQDRVKKDIDRMKEEARREAVEAHAAKAEVEREFRESEDARRKEIAALREERAACGKSWDDEKAALAEKLDSAKAAQQEMKADMQRALEQASADGSTLAAESTAKAVQACAAVVTQLEGTVRSVSEGWYEVQCRDLLSQLYTAGVKHLKDAAQQAERMKAMAESGDSAAAALQQLEQRSAEQSSRIGALEQELKETGSERDKLRGELEAEVAALAALKDAATAKDASITGVTAELQEAKKRVATVEGEREFLETALEREKGLLSKANVASEERQRALEAARVELQTIRRELDRRDVEQNRQFVRQQEERALQLKQLELQREEREREKRVKAEPPPEGERPVTRGATRLRDKGRELAAKQEERRRDLEGTMAELETRMQRAEQAADASADVSKKSREAGARLHAAQQDRASAERRLANAAAEQEEKGEGSAAAEILSLHSQLADAEQQISRMRADAESREEERLEGIQKSRIRVAELEAQLASEEEKLTKHRAGATEQAQVLARTKRDRDALERELAAARGQGEAGLAEVRRLESELDSKEDDVEKMRSANDELEERALEMEEEQAMLRVRLETELAAKEQNAHTARRALERELADVAAKLAAADTVRRKMRDALSKVGGGSLEEMHKELESHDQAVDRAQSATDAVEKQRRALAAQREEAEELRAEKAELEGKLRELERAQAGGGVQDPQLKKKYDEVCEAKRQLLVQLKLAREEARQAKAAASEEQLKKEVDKALKKKEAEFQKKADKTQKKMDQLEAQLKEREAAAAEAAELRTKMEAVEAEMAEMQRTAGSTAELKKECVELRRTTKEALKRVAEVEEMWRKEVILRKRYFNEIQDLKGKIRVMVRCRPMNSIEKQKGGDIVVFFPDEYGIHVPKKKKEYIFDFSFPPSSTQEQVWDESKHFCQSAVDGYNTCIFAYGQTGSGKTHTMEGNPEMPGITPRCINEVFEILESMTSQYDFSVSCYMLELYTDNLHDLLLDKAVKKAGAPSLDIKKDSKGMVFVQGATVRPCPSREDLAIAYTEGCRSRHVRATGMNAASSRSHLVFGIMIETQQRSTGKVITGKMSLVDLAGSERMDKTGIKDAVGQKEAQSINKSLTALGDVIRALSTDPGGFIPYRNNKLTLLMSDSLGGNAKTMMIAAISPASYNVDESCNTLLYASNTKNITNDAQKHQESKEIARLRAIIAKLRKGDTVEAGEEM